MLTEEKK